MSLNNKKEIIENLVSCKEGKMRINFFIITLNQTLDMH